MLIVQLLEKNKKNNTSLYLVVQTWTSIRKKEEDVYHPSLPFWSTITSLDWSTYKGLRNVVVAHVKYDISHRNYPGGTEQKLFSVV